MLLSINVEFKKNWIDPCVGVCEYGTRHSDQNRFFTFVSQPKVINGSKGIKNNATLIKTAIFNLCVRCLLAIEMESEIFSQMELDKKVSINDQ